MPETVFEEFKQSYEFAKVDFIIPNSFVELCRVFGHIVGHFVAFKLSEDILREEFKKQYNAVVRKYDYDPEQAQTKLKEKNKILNQNKTDKEILEVACKENFKEGLTLLIHLKLYLVIIDSCLRYGSVNSFTLVVNFLEPNKKGRLIKKLISIYAEKDKLDFYGTKEQLNDAEDFFPFVWFDIYLKF